MTAQKGNNRKGSVKLLAFILIGICFSIPLISFYLGDGYFSDQNELFNQQIIPKAHSITKDNYSPLLDAEKHGLGNITVENISTEESFGIGFPFVGGYKAEYDKLFDDLNGNEPSYDAAGLNMSFKELRFVECNRIAIVDNLNENITDNTLISIKLNETISVQYNTSKSYSGGGIEGFLIYGPRLYPCRSLGLWIQENNSQEVYEINDGNYSIDEGINFIRFNYDDYFGGVEINNFSMYILWEYNFTINDWELAQYGDPDLDLLINQQEQPITPKFNYQFSLYAEQFNESLQALTEPKIPAYNINFKLKVNLPDKDLLNKTELTINDQIKNIADFNNSDNSMNVGENFHGNNSEFSLDFNCNFTVRFELAVANTWAIDRLVSGRDIRERIYLPSIVSGPSSIYLKYATIYETTISVNQVLKNSSLFERNLVYYDANVSVFEAPTPNSLIFTKNATLKKGLEIKLPYMIKGEISPFIFKYQTTRNLRIKITDNINMPLANFEVRIYYYGLPYGTYISRDSVQPMSPGLTDGNGEVLIRNVPNGNYTLIVYQNNMELVETSVSAFAEINYVLTDIPHVPVLVIVIASLSLMLILIGLIIYNKNKR